MNKENCNNPHLIESFMLFLEGSDLQLKHLAFKNISKLIDISDTHLIKKAIKASTPLLQDPEESRRAFAFEEISELVGKCDIQFINETIKIFMPFLESSDFKQRQLAFQSIAKLIKISGNTDTHLIKKVIKTLIPLQSDSDWRTIKATFRNITELTKLCDNDFIKEIIQEFIPLLQHSSKEDFKGPALEIIVELAKICDPHLIKEIIQTSILKKYKENVWLFFEEREVQVMIVHNAKDDVRRPTGENLLQPGNSDADFLRRIIQKYNAEESPCKSAKMGRKQVLLISNNVYLRQFLEENTGNDDIGFF